MVLATTISTSNKFAKFEHRNIIIFSSRNLAIGIMKKEKLMLGCGKKDWYQVLSV